MPYTTVLHAFSQSGLGMILRTPQGTVAHMNDAAVSLLCLESAPIGQKLEQIAPFLCATQALYGNPAFNQYLLPCPAPTLDGWQGSVVVFRDATKDFRHDLLENTFDHVRHAITIWDDQSRMLLLNNAAAKLESHVMDDVIGQHVSRLYQARSNSILVVPTLLNGKAPLENLRQDFVTHTGKELQIVSNNYPLFANHEIGGAVSIMDDWSKMDSLHKQIIELQSALAGKNGQKNTQNASPMTAKYTFSDIISYGSAMRTTIARCKQFAQSDASVMIFGETGTGKELFAQSIHNASKRAKNPFLAINCAAIPDTLLEAMLFGTEKGAYTGAEKREGLLEQAHTGTLLLDEINSMNMQLQPKLLRVLQEGCFTRVGGSKLIFVDVRIISNINISPAQAMQEERLRKDLYFRLGVINVTVPPLRERREDIPLLAKTFIMKSNEKLKKNVTALSAQSMEIFRKYDWAGNVRELQHAIEYAMHLVPNDCNLIAPEFLPDHILQNLGYSVADFIEFSPETPQTMEQIMEQAGRDFLTKALQENGQSITKTAQAMGITRQNLQHRMRKLGVQATKNRENHT